MKKVISMKEIEAICEDMDSFEGFIREIGSNAEEVEESAKSFGEDTDIIGNFNDRKAVLIDVISKHGMRPRKQRGTAKAAVTSDTEANIDGQMTLDDTSAEEVAEEKPVKVNPHRKAAMEKKAKKFTGWSIPSNKLMNNIISSSRTFFGKFLEDSLGTSPNNKEIYSTYIASRSPNATTIEEEIAAIGEDGYMDKSMTVFPKGKFFRNRETGLMREVERDPLTGEEEATPDNCDIVISPFSFDYQWRGAIKEAWAMLQRAKTNDEVQKALKGLKAYKKIVDGQILISQRKVPFILPETYLDDDGITMHHTLNENGMLPVCQRPLRTSGPTGERTALACSEVVPKGSMFMITISVTDDSLWDGIDAALEYLYYHGFSQWRNSGKGSLILIEAPEDYDNKSLEYPEGMEDAFIDSIPYAYFKNIEEAVEE